MALWRATDVGIGRLGLEWHTWLCEAGSAMTPGTVFGSQAFMERKRVEVERMLNEEKAALVAPTINRARVLREEMARARKVGYKP